MGRKSSAKSAARAKRAAKADSVARLAEYIEHCHVSPLDAVPKADLELAGEEFFKHLLSIDFIRLNPLDAAADLVNNYRDARAMLAVLYNMPLMAKIGAITCARVTEIIQNVRANAVKYMYLHDTISDAVLKASGVGLAEMIHIAADFERDRDQIVQSTRFGEHSKRDSALIKACEIAQTRWARPDDDNYSVRLFKHITDLRASDAVLHQELKKCRDLAITVFGEEARQCINVGDVTEA